MAPHGGCQAESGFLVAGGRKVLRLPHATRYKNAVHNRSYAECVNISSPVAAVVGERMASLHELETVYSYPDLLDMVELLSVRSYNKWVAAQMPKGR